MSAAFLVIIGVLSAFCIQYLGKFFLGLYKEKQDRIKREIEDEAERVRDLYRDLNNLDASNKLTADFANQVEKRTEKLEKRLGEIHEALGIGVHAVDKEARDGFTSVSQRLGAFEQALGYQDSSIRQIMAVLSPPRTREQAQADLGPVQETPAPTPTRTLSMNEQIAIARQAAKEAGAQQ